MAPSGADLQIRDAKSPKIFAPLAINSRRAGSLHRMLSIQQLNLSGCATVDSF
jgi:hypothetical protein